MTPNTPAPARSESDFNVDQRAGIGLIAEKVVNLRIAEQGAKIVEFK